MDIETEGGGTSGECEDGGNTKIREGNIADEDAT